MWLEMIIDKNLMSSDKINETRRLMEESTELTSIFIATRKTMERKISAKNYSKH